MKRKPKTFDHFHAPSPVSRLSLYFRPLPYLSMRGNQHLSVLDNIQDINFQFKNNLYSGLYTRCTNMFRHTYTYHTYHTFQVW
jgi:hypothetical protein